MTDFFNFKVGGRYRILTHETPKPRVYHGEIVAKEGHLVKVLDKFHKTVVIDLSNILQAEEW